MNLIDDAANLNLEVEFQFLPPKFDRCNLIFKNESDRDLYRLLGKWKEDDYLVFKLKDDFNEL